MRKSVIIIFLSIVSFSARSQVSISNLSLTDTTQSIFYIGVDNLIRISGKQYHYLKQSVAIIGGGGILIPRGPGVYIVQVRAETDNCQLWINENRKTIFKKNFKVRNLGFPPVASVVGFKDTTITLSQLLVDPTLQISIPECLYTFQFSVSAYKATIKHGNEISSISVKNNKLTENQLDLVKRLGAGDEIFFDEIIASTGSFQSIKCLPFRITIENP